TAIEYAEDGFVVSAQDHEQIALTREKARRWPTTAAIYLPDGDAPRVGTILRQPDQARTLRAIAEGGAEAFYRGPIGEEIVRFSQEHGGLLTLDDLATYAPTWQEPISTSYRGFTVYCPPPPCMGIEYLMTLNLLEGLDIAALGHNT